MSSRPESARRGRPSPFSPRAPSAIGVMRAAVAVFDSTVEIAAEAVPNAAMRPGAVRAKTGRPSSADASRTSRP